MDSTEEMLVARSEVEEWEKSCGVAEEVALETGLRRGFREGRSPLEGNFGRIRWTRGRPFAKLAFLCYLRILITFKNL